MAFGVAMLTGRNAGISPEMRSRELEALRSAWNIWNEHRQTSQDAARAVRVLGPIIRKASAVESLPQTTATYPSPVEGVPRCGGCRKNRNIGRDHDGFSSHTRIRLDRSRGNRCLFERSKQHRLGESPLLCACIGG